MRKQKIYQLTGIVFIVLLLLVGISGFFYRGRQTTTPPLIKPALQKTVETEFQITSTIAEENFPKTEKLPIYTVSHSAFSTQIVDGIATNLGFQTNNRNEFYDVNQGKVLVWYSDDGKSLRIVPNIGLIEYKKIASLDEIAEEQIDQTPFISETDAAEIATSFITTNGLLVSDSIDDVPSINYISFEEEGKRTVDASEARYMDLQYIFRVNNYPILNDAAARGSVNVILERDGEVHTAYINNIPSIIVHDEYPLKNFNEFQEKLATEAYIQMISDGEIPVYEINQDMVRNIVVNEITIAFYEEQKSSRNTLQPVYLLKGVAFLTNGNQTEIVLYMPAIKSGYLSE